ncbi:MAG: phenylalanine--tRNA ligase subunit beta [Sedimentisphaerales bacterium]|nr:phenylalanine--tRNA ligase subunit beta [Sedimentisphaerales bacterium]
MKISLSWLKDYIDLDDSAERISEILSDVGFPCEGIEHVDDDAVIDVEVTSNRGDCLGHIGLARELAAATGKEVKLPSAELDESDKDVAEFSSVGIREPELCGRYTARIIDGVKVAPSPDWLRKRLEAIGLRSVNNVVDATNYAMMETGQPPHAFDYAKIDQGMIIVRKAAAGERLVSIDGTQCELDPDMLIIADARGPVAIAGVMGGLETEVSDTTTTILLEDASFDPVSVRTTSRKLALPSEASYRFERIVDIEQVDWASQRTAQLITKVAGGRVAKGVVDIYPGKPGKKEVTLRPSRLAKLLGIEIPLDRAVEILAALKFVPAVEGDIITCTVPSWRSDIYREVDLIEEVARVHGYGAVPTERKIKIEVVPVDPRQRLAQSIGTYLNGCGYYETINVSFVDQSTAELFVETDDKRHLTVKDESRKSANLLRRTLMGSLLGVLKTNLNAKNVPCRIYELADVFTPKPQQEGGLPVEKAMLSLVCDGDFRDLRGTIEGLIRSVKKEAKISFEPSDLTWAQVGAAIMVNGEALGTAGIVSKAIKEKFDFKEGSPCAAELDFEQLLTLSGGIVTVKPIPKYPSIQRDLSLIVDEGIRWMDIEKAVQCEAPSELENIQFVGIYRGKGIAGGKKSVTLSLRFRDDDGTLTHENVDRFEADIVGRLADAVSAELRTV